MRTLSFILARPNLVIPKTSPCMVNYISQQVCIMHNKWFLQLWVQIAGMKNWWEIMGLCTQTHRYVSWWFESHQSDTCPIWAYSVVLSSGNVVEQFQNVSTVICPWICCEFTNSFLLLSRSSLVHICSLYLLHYWGWIIPVLILFPSQAQNYFWGSRSSFMLVLCSSF